jgi:hypothetical protein
VSNQAFRPLRVFLSHSSYDKPVVRELYQRLLAEGWIDPWLDEAKILPGQDWNLEIEKAVDAADIIIVCLSSYSVTKEGYILRELKMALDLADEKPEGTLFIVPVRLEEAEVPRRFRNWQFADYFPPSNRERTYQQLLVSLRRQADRLGIPSDSSAPRRIDLQSKTSNVQESTAASKKPIELFISYSHRDERYCNKLKAHLSNLRRQGIIDDWHDRKIIPGQEWATKIDGHINSAKIILLLISADFVASDYCWEIEVARAMERHEAGEATVIPIIIRPTDWTGTPFSKLQALPQNAKPITIWPDQDSAFLDVVTGIRAAIG